MQMQRIIAGDRPGSTAEQPPPPPSPPGTLIPTLPNDVSLLCLARVPRPYHPALAAVSKPIRSLLSSPHLFTTRHFLNFTQPSLYLWVDSDHLRRPRWLALHRRSDPSDTTHSEPSLFRLTLSPPIPVPYHNSALAALENKLYVIGGNNDDDNGSSDVWVFDCRFHTWERGPRMGAARSRAWAGVIDGKIYVMKGVEEDQEANWMEVFDPEVGRWEAVPTPFGGVDDWFYICKVIDGKICVRTGREDLEEFRFDPPTRTWEGFESEPQLMPEGQICVVDGLLFCCDAEGTIRGFDEQNGGVWREVNGVAEKMPESMVEPRIVNLEGRLIMLWGQLGNGSETFVRSGERMELWCAEIEVRMGKDGEWWGQVHCLERFLSLLGPALNLPEGLLPIIFGFFYDSACFSVSLWGNIGYQVFLINEIFNYHALFSNPNV